MQCVCVGLAAEDRGYVVISFSIAVFPAQSPTLSSLLHSSARKIGMKGLPTLALPEWRHRHLRLARFGSLASDVFPLSGLDLMVEGLDRKSFPMV